MAWTNEQTGQGMPPGGEGKGGGDPPPPSLVCPTRPSGERRRSSIKQIERRGGDHPIMNPDHEKLLSVFEAFELDLEVEEILKKVKADRVPDQSVHQFAEELAQRDQQKRVAQAEREAQVQQQWSPGHYPQLTCDWFVQGLNYCCDYRWFQFKRPLTPPPAPSPDLGTRTINTKP